MPEVAEAREAAACRQWFLTPEPAFRLSRRGGENCLLLLTFENILASLTLDWPGAVS